MGIAEDLARVRERFPEAFVEHDAWGGRWYVRPAPGDRRWVGSGPSKKIALQQAAHFAHATYTAQAAGESREDGGTDV